MDDIDWRGLSSRQLMIKIAERETKMAEARKAEAEARKAATAKAWR